MRWVSFVCCCKQMTAYEMRISDWSSDVCSSDLVQTQVGGDDRGKLQLHRFEAAVDFARHADMIALDVHGAGKGALRPAGERGEHLAGLVVVVVRSEVRRVGKVCVRTC